MALRYLTDMAVWELLSYCDEAYRRGLCGPGCQMESSVCEAIEYLRETDNIDCIEIDDFEDEEAKE